MLSPGFKPTIKKLQAYFCDGTATRIGTRIYLEERLIYSAVYLGSINLSKYIGTFLLPIYYRSLYPCVQIAFGNNKVLIIYGSLKHFSMHNI